MTLSRSSRSAADPLSAVLVALETRATRRTLLEADGKWALSFPALNRLKFVAVLRGGCWLSTDGRPREQLSVGDVVLIGRIGYVIASDSTIAPVDGMALHVSEGDRLRLGGDATVLVGGGVAFASGLAAFLLDMLPPLLIVRGSTASAVTTVLRLLDREACDDRLGGEAVSARLAELLVVEAIRFCAAPDYPERGGWLAALTDPRVGRSLRAFHSGVADRWTVANLATQAGMSRAAFSATFAVLVGVPPLRYVRRWRLTLARARLRAGQSIDVAAAEVGYTSQSAFSHAYRREFGVSPGIDREGGRRGSSSGDDRRRSGSRVP